MRIFPASTTQGVVNDSPSTFQAGTVQQIQITGEGRIKVITESESINYSTWGDPESWDNEQSQDEYYTAW